MNTTVLAITWLGLDGGGVGAGRVAILDPVLELLPFAVGKVAALLQHLLVLAVVVAQLPPIVRQGEVGGRSRPLEPDLRSSRILVILLFQENRNYGRSAKIDQSLSFWKQIE